MDGIILIDKPKNWTSHDVVAKVRGNLKAQTGKKIKVGHTGTLDPMATGLLVLVIGNYTKKAQDFNKLDKVYEAEVILGSTSETGDKEGKLTKISEKQPSDIELRAFLSKLTGKIKQKPHIYSAIKVNGQRAYKLARAGKKPNLEPREVEIFEIKDINYLYPSLSFKVHVSSGTYIRSLAEDIGEALATGAYLSALKRIKVGNYRLEQALTIDELNQKRLQNPPLFDII
jgi:tRNA pseudouridine55 synthase